MNTALQRRKELFGLWLMWILIAAFVVALGLMFVHPTLAMLIFWLGLMTVGAAWLAQHFVFRESDPG